MNVNAELLESLADTLSPSQANSLLLEVMRRRAGRVKPSHVVGRWTSNRFSRPSPVSPMRLLELSQLAYRELSDAGFEPIELSPLAPFGMHNTVGAADQNRVVSALRDTEVVADTTTALAVEAATRRNQDAKSSVEPVRLCSAQRVVRAQLYSDPNALAHFTLLALVTAGRDVGSWRFEHAALIDHIDAQICVLTAFREAGLDIQALIVRLGDFSDGHRSEQLREAQAEIATRHPGTCVEFDPGMKPIGDYYVDVRFRISVVDSTGRELELTDGGITRWTQTLLGNRKERLMTSGLGIELLALLL